jgi:putative salt-induced outer membrane protein
MALGAHRRRPDPQGEDLMNSMYRHLALLPLLASGLVAQAQTAPDGQWHGGANIGAAFASGNASSQVVAGAADAAKATAADKISLYGAANYASNKAAGVSTTTANLLRLGGRYDYNLSATTFVFGGLESETNKAAGLKSRDSVNAGLGYKLVRTAETTWDLFGGVGYDDVRFTGGVHQSGAAFLLGEESTHKLSATTSAKQRLAVYPGTGALGNRVTFDAGLATAITGGWTLNTGLTARYASKVPAGVKSTDTLLTFGFGYKF